MIRKHFRLKRIALGLALATAVVAPTAQAAVYVDGPTPGVQAGYIRAAAYQLKVEGMRWQAMAKQYESQPGITAAGAALANQKHSALTVPDQLKIDSGSGDTVGASPTVEVGAPTRTASSKTPDRSSVMFTGLSVVCPVFVPVSV